ncbi:MAG: hypothetical protein ABF461_08165 [Zymomonas mobilis subsp. pomaceae]|uniref:hypothetical protein n=1 Tax=Zymomonas mobilis TaxID=542 RepID=UPI0039E8F5A0
MSLDKKRPFDSKQATEKHAPRGKLIALVGCDGSGKSSLTSDLIGVLQKYRPVRRYYLGLGSGDLGRKIGKIPLVGSWIESRLKQKAKATRTKGEKIPGALTALVVYAFSLIRFFHYLQMRYALNAGITVITDRYPQAEIAGQWMGPVYQQPKPETDLLPGWYSQKRVFTAGWPPSILILYYVLMSMRKPPTPENQIMTLKLCVSKPLS